MLKSATRTPGDASLSEQMERALAFHRRGDLGKAEREYRQILAAHAHHFDALRLLGWIKLGQASYEESARLLTAALRANPASLEVLCNLGLALAALNRRDEAIAAYDKALASRPDNAEAHNNRGVILRDLRRPEEAVASFDRAVAVRPDYAEAWYNRGNALRDIERVDEALASYDKAVASRPHYAEAWCSRGMALRSLDRLEEALASHDQALANKPDYIEALYNRANVLRDLGSFPEALAGYDRVLALVPGFAEAHNNRGATLLDLERCEEALASCDAALAIRPDYVEALYNKANVLRGLKRLTDAIALYERTLTLRPDYLEAWNNRGLALHRLKLFAEALTSFERALAIKQDHAEVLNNRGAALFELKRFDAALASYDRAVAAKPDYAEALMNRGALLHRLNRYQQSIADIERVVALDRDVPYAQGQLLHSHMACCDWRSYALELAHVTARVREGRRTCVPLAFLGISDSSRDQQVCARTWAQDNWQASPLPLWRGELYRHERIRVAYLSADFRDHAVSYLLAGVLEEHDHARFETIAVSFGSEVANAMRSRVLATFDRAIEVRARSDAEVANLLREIEVDIAVDLMGYTQDSRTGILARRPAPLQVNYLGFAGTMGAEYFDYIIADRMVIPDTDRSHYDEHVVYLPDTFMGTDAKRRIAERTPSRAEVGLPENGFVFCSFNSSYKITPRMFDVWMRLLHQVEDSVLWLSSMNEIAVANLRREAQARVIDPARLVFARQMERQEDHLARLRLADLFVDTLPYNAHTTASDALWAGLPIITCLGSTFAGRVAGSLLAAVGLPELVTRSLADYEALASRLAHDPPLLASIRAKLARNRTIHPLFDTVRFCRHLEAAYLQMWQRHHRGEPPASFAVQPMDNAQTRAGDSRPPAPSEANG